MADETEIENLKKELAELKHTFDNVGRHVYVHQDDELKFQMDFILDIMRRLAKIEDRLFPNMRAERGRPSLNGLRVIDRESEEGRPFDTPES